MDHPHGYGTVIYYIPIMWMIIHSGFHYVQGMFHGYHPHGINSVDPIPDPFQGDLSMFIFSLIFIPKKLPSGKFT